MKRNLVIGILTAFLLLLADSCTSQGGSLLYLNPRLESCLELENGTRVSYHGWPLSEQFTFEAISEFKVDGAMRSGVLKLEIPSREEDLAKKVFPVCAAKDDPACKDQKTAFVLATYREFLVDTGGKPVPVFASSSAEGTLEISGVNNEMSLTQVAAGFDIVFKAGSATRRFINGGLGIQTSPPSDSGDCPEK